MESWRVMGGVGELWGIGESWDGEELWRVGNS